LAISKKEDLSRWAWGKQAVLELLKSRPHQVQEIIMASPEQDPLRQEIFDLCKGIQVPVLIKARRQIDRLLPVPAHQAVIARLKGEPPFFSLEELLGRLSDRQIQSPVLLALDHIQDPQNLGAMIRTAECAGVAGILLPRDRSCPVSGTVRKAAAGALDHLPLVQVINLVRALEMLKEKGFWILSLEARSSLSLYDLDLRVPLVVVVGGESQGIGTLVRRHSDWTASIPMAGTLSSLNASVACGLVLFEIARQRINVGKK
jgi:23S rRNA (guanosine2251-2'-O)-methyltransferase